MSYEESDPVCLASKAHFRSLWLAMPLVWPPSKSLTESSEKRFVGPFEMPLALLLIELLDEVLALPLVGPFDRLFTVS